MKMLRLKTSLIYNFTLQALLLNCVGIVILQMVNSYGVTMQSAGWLEAFKDFSILISSFFFASFIPKIGYKPSIVLGILIDIVGCVLMALFPSILMARFFFIAAGVGFAFLKVSIYSSAVLITDTDTEHASFISILEGFFMVGVLFAFWLFGFFMHMGNWLLVYWVLAFFGLIGIFLILTVRLDESKLHEDLQQNEGHTGYRAMFNLFAQVALWGFIILVICYLFIEQGVINWLPTFNNHVLHISSAASVEIASLLSAGMAFGRLFFGAVMKYIHWTKILIICIVMAIVTLFISLYLSAHIQAPKSVLTNWSQFPFVSYLLPFIGFLVAPIYPTLCSSILSKQPPRLHSATTVWILVFSALGGALGAKIMGNLFATYGGLSAIAVLAVPLSVLLIFIVPYYSVLKRSSA